MGVYARLCYANTIQACLGGQSQRAYRLLVIALLNEGRPDGPWGNCIAPDAPGDEVGPQALGECSHCPLHVTAV